MKAGHVFTIEPMICEGEKKGCYNVLELNFNLLLVTHDQISSLLCLFSFWFISTPSRISSSIQYHVEN